MAETVPVLLFTRRHLPRKIRRKIAPCVIQKKKKEEERKKRGEKLSEDELKKTKTTAPRNLVLTSAVEEPAGWTVLLGRTSSVACSA